MRKIFKYLSLAIFTLVVILLVVPLLISVDHYKEILIVEVKKATGRDFVIGGEMSLSLLPRPSVKLSQVKLSSLPKAQEPQLLEVEKAYAALSIWHLITGNIVISYVELEAPVITLETLKDGRGTWEFTKSDLLKTSPTMEQSTKEESSPTLPIENLIIKNGKMQYVKDNEKTIIEDIDLDVGIESLKGPINFTTSFRASEHDFDMEGKIMEIKEVIPLTMKLRVLDEKIALDGIFLPKSTSFKGALTLQGNLKNLLQDSSSIQVSKGLMQDHKIDAQLLINKDAITLNSINVIMGNVKAEGNGKYHINHATGDLKLALNPGKVAVEIIGGKATVGGFESKIRIHSKTIKLLLEALEIDTNKLPAFINQEFSFGTIGRYKNEELLLKEIHFTLGQATLKGHLGIQDKAQKSIFSYDIKTDNATALINLLGGNIPFNIADMQVEGETTKDGDNFQTNTNLSVAKAHTNITGNIGVNSSSILINTSGNSLAQTINRLFDSNALPGLGNFSLSAAIQGDLSKIFKVKLKQSTIDIGNEKTILNGTSTINLGGSKPKLSVELASSSINLDTLVGKSSSQTTTTPAGRSTVHHKKQEVSANAPWSHEEINLAALQSFDGDFSLLVKKLTKGSLVFDNIKANMQLKKGILNITSVTGNLYGGRLEGVGFISSQAEQAMSFKASLKQAQLRDIVPSRNEIKITRGIFNLTSDLNSKGKSQYDYINNLSGDINFNGADGQLSGVDLQRVLDTLSQAKNIEGVLMLLDASFSGGDTDFESLEGAFVITQGIARLTNFKLIAKKILATATGNIDLPKYLMDIDSTITVDIKDMPPFKAHLYGTLDNPQHKLETKVLQQYLLTNILTNVLEGVNNGKSKPKDIIKNLIGFESKKDDLSQQGGSTSTPESTEEKPIDKLIQKGLEGLFKK